MGVTLGINPISLIEKAINEHGSSEILKERLTLASDQFVALHRKASELEREIGKLEAKLQREQLDRDKAEQELKRLQKEHEEEIVIHEVLEFRRGKRTLNKWLPFCPACHAPAGLNQCDNETLAYCVGNCSKETDAGLIASFPYGTTLALLVSQLPP